MNEHKVVYPYSGTLLSKESDQATGTCKLGKSQNHDDERKKSEGKAYIAWFSLSKILDLAKKERKQISG